jgi:aspartyl-tRNA(Asn)/glutamyl-tRNA(Gln) amidotransferase subunit B
VKWEAVIGIEVHVQLRTGRKLFCADRADFGADPNSNVCPVCLGLPGALPVPDPAAVELAVRTALAFDCSLHDRSVWARKNYFYPDLPKGYQITQFAEPIATGGSLTFGPPDSASTVRLTRIHMEEDAGKSVHDRIPGATAVDLNRAGTPLVEIVTEPDLRSAEDVRAFLVELKLLLLFMDVSDCNMEEGSLRADANVSLRRPGSETLGTKTEIKNVNSFSGLEKAVRLEIDRQAEVLDAGGAVRSATLLWDDHRQLLRTMRSKEESHDYRYFPDPDLPPLDLAPDLIESVRNTLPERPRCARARLQREYGVSEYEAGVLTQSSAAVAYFDELVRESSDPAGAAKWVMGPLQAIRNARDVEAGQNPVSAVRLAEVMKAVVDGTVSDGAGKRLLEAMVDDDRPILEMIEALGLRQIRDTAALDSWIAEVFEAHPEEVGRYRAGETRLLGFLVGRVMGKSRGSADPRMVNEGLRARLDQGSGSQSDPST